MLTIQEAVAMGMEKFNDERHFCNECRHYSFKPWKGKCAAQLQQYVVLNRCGNFSAKRVYVNEDKPFWE